MEFIPCPGGSENELWCTIALIATLIPFSLGDYYLVHIISTMHTCDIRARDVMALRKNCLCFLPVCILEWNTDYVSSRILKCYRFLLHVSFFLFGCTLIFVKPLSCQLFHFNLPVYKRDTNDRIPYAFFSLLSYDSQVNHKKNAFVVVKCIFYLAIWIKVHAVNV